MRTTNFEACKTSYRIVCESLNNVHARVLRCHVLWEVPLLPCLMMVFFASLWRSSEDVRDVSVVGASRLESWALYFWRVPSRRSDSWTGLKPWVLGDVSNKIASQPLERIQTRPQSKGNYG